ncbi:UvrD-helicase domain-containing protein [Cytobacillus firmus]|uniref:UvrD-helicase domain-containing protein n=1 Tax=Cytobacillus firmus TaxID=1399 RepID=UPI0018CF32DA|nr:ATP-dependent helicase [Cytobacillus firmus]
MCKNIGGIMLPLDKDVRDQILVNEGNIVISASAGTGKTHTTIQRIIRDIEKNNNYKTFAAITFTRKAAREIVNRLGINKGGGFVGTNDNFILSEIIQPFMYDFYGPNYKLEIKPDFNDENQIADFQEGIKKIEETQLMCKFIDNKKNFAFQLALIILKESHSARRYLKSKYYRIYIDEYQDSDVDMHNLFMYICDDLSIPLFIVGDTKQSIYRWRGAYSDGFEELTSKSNFKKFELWHNFRSNTIIQNYSNIFMESVRHHYRQSDFNNEIIAFEFNTDEEAANYINDWIDTSKKCAFLNFSNSNAEKWSKQLNGVNLPFVFIPGSPLDYSNLESEHIWVARCIANYELQNKYSEYDVMDEIPMPEAYRIIDLKKLLFRIKDSHNNFDLYEKNCMKLYEYLGYRDDIEKIKREIKTLFEVVNDDRFVPTYNQESYSLTCGTIHSSKGLEFEQVIINAGDFNMSRDGAIFLHYVAISRPEQRLLIIGEPFYFKRYLGYIQGAVKKTKDLGIDISIESIIKLVGL